MIDDSDDFLFEDDDEVVSYHFELIASFDGKITTLVCQSDESLDVKEYASALREFATHLEQDAERGLNKSTIS